MPPRPPPPTRRLLAAHAPLHRPPETSLLPRPRPTQQQPSQPLPRLLQPTTTVRTLTTTTRRNWLLSALTNLPTPSTPPPPKTLRARRLLPYPPSQIYTLIADIDAYTRFLPHCTHSHVTKWTATRHPALADLTVGWGPFTQTYTSRVYCVPGSVVEAVSGSAGTSIAPGVLREAGYEYVDDGDGAGQKMDGIFESLVTRWTVQPVSRADGNEWSEVTLSVTFQFANPALGFAVGQLADDKVDEMVEAFEARARELYGAN